MSLCYCQIVEAFIESLFFYSCYLIFLKVSLLTTLYCITIQFKAYMMTVLSGPLFLQFLCGSTLSMCSLCAPEVSSYVIAQEVPSVLTQRPRIADRELKFVDNGNSVLRLGWWQWTSALVFMWGWIHQLWCHKILVKINFDINFALIIGIPFQFCLVC